jgi:hypothetical protein
MYDNHPIEELNLSALELLGSGVSHVLTSDDEIECDRSVSKEISSTFR